MSSPTSFVDKQTMPPMQEAQTSSIVDISAESTNSMNTNVISRLCPELLSKIFLHCMDAGSPKKRFQLLNSLPAFSVNDMPMKLTHVSSHWRAVAIRTQPLWTIIRLGKRPWDEAQDYHPARDLKALQLYEKRSGKMPIDLFFGYQSVGRADWAIGQKSIALMIAHILMLHNRLRVLYLGVPYLLTLDMLGVLRDFTFPSLEALWYRADSGGANRENDCCVNLSKFPAAKVVKLHGYNVMPLMVPTLWQQTSAGPGDSPKLPICELEQLQVVDCMMAAQTIITLGLQPTLRVSRLRLCFTPESETYAISDRKIFAAISNRYTLSTVTHLQILDSHPSGFHTARVLECIRLPSLEILDISGWQSKTKNGCVHLVQGNWPSLSMMLIASVPPLKSLRIEHVLTTTDAFLDCLESVDGTLQEIIGDESMFTREIVRALTWPALGTGLSLDDSDGEAVRSNEAVGIVPCLTRIEVLNDSKCCPDALVEFILSRTSHNAGLGSDSQGWPRPHCLNEVVLRNCTKKEFLRIPEDSRILGLIAGGELTVRII